MEQFEPSTISIFFDEVGSEYCDVVYWLVGRWLEMEWTVSRWERGRTVPQLSEVEHITTFSIFVDKTRYLNKPNINLVTPSGFFTYHQV